MFTRTHRRIDVANTSYSTQQLWSVPKAMWSNNGVSVDLGSTKEHWEASSLALRKASARRALREWHATTQLHEKKKQTKTVSQHKILALGFFSLNIDFWNGMKFDLCHITVSFLPHVKWQHHHLFGQLVPCFSWFTTLVTFLVRVIHYIWWRMLELTLASSLPNTSDISDLYLFGF